MESVNEQEIAKEKKKRVYECDHGKKKYDCRTCNSASFCQHGRKKGKCKDCGAELCRHKKQIMVCEECNNTYFCQHGKHKHNCKDCSPASFCEHNKRKHQCKKCGGIGICEHDICKYDCKICTPSSFCEHNIGKRSCKVCTPSSFCEHEIRKSTCKKCGGASICEHNINKYQCKDCNGKTFCKHDKRKAYCKECGGTELCKSSWCETSANPKYDKYCAYCYFNLFPDNSKCRNYKTKEKYIVDAILETFPNFSWTTDKKVQDGCSKRRPDMFLDMGFQVIIVEIDENQHATYDTTCENKRLMELSQDVGHTPIVFIRFNPDDYVENDEKIKSCWKANEQSGILEINPKKKKEWEERIKTLNKAIKYWTKNETTKTVEVVKLFYDH